MQIIKRLSFANILTILLQVTRVATTTINRHASTVHKAQALTGANDTRQDATDSRDGAYTWENDAIQLHHCAFCRWQDVTTFNYAKDLSRAQVHLLNGAEYFS